MRQGERVRRKMISNNCYDMCLCEMGRGSKGRMPGTPCDTAKPLKRLKTAMGSYSFGATSACVWRHIR
jgi:hypothetical protein